MNLIKTSQEFKPDIVVEVTMACDLKCKGCYAPTFSPKLLKQREDAFLSIKDLSQAMASILASTGETQVSIIALRGGEPTLHPQLDCITALLRPLASSLYLETNGSWILGQNEKLLKLCAELEVIVKISFDSMHSLSEVKLAQICDILDVQRVQWIVAITEATDAEFEASRSLCSWVPREKIVFQRKIFDQNLLIRPRYGVVHPNGQISTQLTSKRLL